MEESSVRLWGDAQADQPTLHSSSLAAPENEWPKSVAPGFLAGDSAAQVPPVSGGALLGQGSTPRVKNKRKYKPRERKHPVPFLSNLVLMFEKTLTTYFRHGNYNSFLRQLNNFGFNKVEAPSAAYALYAKVQGEKVKTMEGLLALRPRERKTTTASTNSNDFTVNDDHHFSRSKRRRQPDKFTPFLRMAARQGHDAATSATDRSWPFPSPLDHHQTVQQPALQIPEQRQLQRTFRFGGLNRAFRLQLQQQFEAATRGANADTKFVAAPHLKHPIDVVDPRRDEIAGSAASREKGLRAPTRPSFGRRPEMSDVEALLSLSGNKASNGDKLLTRQDCDAIEEKKRRLPDVRLAPNLAAVSPPQSRSFPPSVVFPQPQSNEVPVAARWPRVAPSRRRPSRHFFLPPTKVRKVQNKEERETAAAPQRLVKRAILDELRTCVACFDKSRVCVFADCGHFVLCLSCAKAHSHTKVPCQHCTCSLVLDQHFCPL
ncbi:hypothetical protein CTAYLR_008194 [Chrysophaeum taylorii]|uniref:HSF-type DNA-binding domain-containing protein n=1 Tax=Chrysophaeum taylorii TaxID=2483200 RepID=A0AAD7UBF8_9STRA|nr:hypothetical protein CTAYLR_008194 [Chrysophaeum taylorii]